MKKLLAYGFDENKKQLIRNSAEKFSMEVSFLKNEDLGKKLGHLLGLKGFESGDEKIFPVNDIELFYFSDFDREILKSFLLDLKDKGLIISHKAVETQTNVNWSLYYLLNQIEKERILLIKFNKLGFLVKKAQDKIKDEGTNKTLEKLISRGMDLKKPPINERVLDQVISDFEKNL